jgi:hypothetical protein
VKTKLLGLIAFMALLGVSQAGAATLVGTTTDATGIDGLVVDGITYNVTFSDASYNSVYASSTPIFLGNFLGAQHASTALATALNALGVVSLTEISNSTEAAFIPYTYIPGAVTTTEALCNPCSSMSPWSGTWSEVYDDAPAGDISADYAIFVSQTPLPAALPLFAGGLGALSLLGWRRKRKGAALGAA